MNSFDLISLAIFSREENQESILNENCRQILTLSSNFILNFFQYHDSLLFKSLVNQVLLSIALSLNTKQFLHFPREIQYLIFFSLKFNQVSHFLFVSFV